MRIVQKTQMQHNEFIATLFLATQMARSKKKKKNVNLREFWNQIRGDAKPIFCMSCINYRHRLVFLINSIDPHAHFKTFHKRFICNKKFFRSKITFKLVCVCVCVYDRQFIYRVNIYMPNALTIRVARRQLGDDPKLLGVRGQCWGAHRKRPCR